MRVAKAAGLLWLWQVLQGLLRDHGAEHEPAEVFTRLLTCGTLSPALHQFLTSSLGSS